MQRLFRLGTGPLEALYQRQHDGEIGAALARAEAALLAPHYPAEELLALADDLVALARSGQWEIAYALHVLLVAVTMADRQRFSAGESQLAVCHLRLATFVLYQRPDRALYIEARTRGERAHAAESDSERRSTLAHELGLLHLDPWAANRGNDAHMTAWLRKAVDAESSRLGEPDGLPTRADALRIAERWLRDALPERQGVDRLITLKALVQCRTATPGFREGEARQALHALLAEALPLLSVAPERSDIRNFLVQVAHAVGAPDVTSVPSLAELRSVDWTARAARIGHELMVQEVLTALRALLAHQSSEALEFARDVQELFARGTPDSERQSYYEIVIDALAGARQPVLASSDDVTRALADLPARRSDVIAAVLAFVSEDREEEAQLLVRQLLVRDPALGDAWPDAMLYLAASLATGAAVNAVKRNEWRIAQAQYRAGWPAFASLALPDQLFDTLRNLASTIRHCGDDEIEAMCREVLETSVPSLGPRVDEWMRACARIADVSLATLQQRGTAALSAWFTLLRLAKGPAFARQILHDEHFAWRDDVRARELDARLASLPASSDPLGAPPSDITLMSYFSTPLATSGATTAEQRTNLERTFDLTVRAQLAERVREGTPMLDLARVQALLDEDSVLLDFFVTGPDQDASACCLALSRNDHALFVLRTPPFARHVAMDHESATEELTDAGMAVMSLREAVRVAPTGDASVTPEGAAAIALLTARVLGPAGAWLERQWALGKRRLLLVPNGPLHFAPLHLLGTADSPLCATWRVSMVPSLELLSVRDERYSLPGAAVFGVSYTNDPWGRPRLGGARAEARAIAKKLGVSDVLDDDVTPDAVRRALTTCGVVHLACHGSHNAAAPSLQALELAPAADGTRRFTAADLHALDLRGLRLLTLSACETALGRFDLGDNLRGLLAAALGAGAHCVVGTLWQVSDRAAALFFDHFYAGIAADIPVDEAFHAAQQHTRGRLPQVRDWGAFYLCRA